MKLDAWINQMGMSVEIAGISRIAVQNWQNDGCPDNLDGFLDAHGYSGREVRKIAAFALEACKSRGMKPEPLPA